MQILDGGKAADEILEKVKHEVEQLKEKGINPKLVVILVGNNPASLSYIRQKKKACIKTGIICEQIDFEESIAAEDLTKKIDELNSDNTVHGILVQLPLPKHISIPLVIRAICPNKDVDGLHAYNAGKMFLSAESEKLVPCTPKGVIKLLKYYDIDVKGKDVTVVGHSNIAGKPMSIMLLNRNATVTTCHIDTKNLKQHTLGAEILISAVGKPGLITEDMVKQGVVVIDIGCTKVGEKLYGDTDFEKVSKKASYITPVPGGVGPMTVACLMENVVIASKELNNIE